jgi:hypothetical protein
MNIQNMQKLIAQLERLPDKQFDMEEAIAHKPECGTVACIAGWASLLNGGPQVAQGGETWPLTWARDWLDLTSRQATRLFFGEWLDAFDDEGNQRWWGSATREEAIEELKSMVNHGGSI